ncbi:MAG: hypothetical protein IPL65_10445 [Lewinellaceae bacterium]|nr:hypothetical protein [Lewinellaceae bacterium]
MSKKKFTAGLDDLFKDMPAFDSQQQGDGHATAQEAETRPKSTGKSFAGSLDSMLQEALEESLSHFEQQPAASLSGKNKSREFAHRAPHSGLDALLRQTIDIQEITRDEETGKKRLTVAVDKSKLEKLKVIARLENAYMKDLLIELIDEFIEDYRKEKGVDI